MKERRKDVMIEKKKSERKVQKVTINILSLKLSESTFLDG